MTKVDGQSDLLFTVIHVAYVCGLLRTKQLAGSKLLSKLFRIKSQNTGAQKLSKTSGWSVRVRVSVVRVVGLLLGLVYSH